MKLRGLMVVKSLMNVVVLLSFLGYAVPVMAAGEPRIIGVWENNGHRDSYKIIITEYDGKIVVTEEFNDGIKIIKEVIGSQGVAGTVYKPGEKTNEDYYIIAQTGNLQVWDERGLRTSLEGYR